MKAQIHAGGRGKAGGVKVVKSDRRRRRSEADAHARHDAGDPPDRPARQEVNRLYIEEGSTSTASSISRCWSTARPRASPSWSRPKAAWTSRRSRTRRRRRSSPSRSIRRPASCRITAARVAQALKLDRRSRQAGRRHAAQALRRLHRQGHEPARDQSAGRHQGRQAHLPRRQGRLRRQRALPPPRHRGAARRDRGGPEGDRGVEVRPQLCRARRLDRLHGQRRRPCHGDHGHHQALRRRRRTSSTSAAAPPRRR